MNIIKIKVDFAKRRIEKEGVKLTEGDYNSTKLLFEFNVENQDGRKVFELAKPDTDEAIFVQEIVDNEVILVGKAEVKDEHGYIKYVDQEENIYWYDAENNKVYDAEYQEQEISIETLTKVLVDASIFDEEGSYPFEISLYDGDSKLTSAYSSLKVAKEMVKIGEERISTYMPIFDQLMQQIQRAINETNTLNISVEREGDTAIITITKKDGTTEVVRISGGGGGGGTFNHADLDNLDYEHSGHTGFQEEIDDLDDIRSGANAGATAVQDNNYVHTDNNYTTQEKTKLAGLNNYDDTALSGRVANAEDDIDNLETTVAGHTTAIGNKQDKLTSANAGNNVTITEVDGVMKINSTGESGGTSDYTALSNKPKINNVELNGNKTLDDLGIQPKGNYALPSDIPTNLAELADDTTHRTVTDTEKQNWNNKSNFSGNYNDLSNKPTIPTVPTNVSSFTNDSGYLTLDTLPIYDGSVI